MVKSKTDILSVLLLLTATLSATGLLIWSTVDWFILENKFEPIERILLMSFSAIGTGLFLWFEFPKLNSIEVTDNEIILMNLLSRTKSKIHIDELDGFTTSSKWAKGGPVCEISLIRKGKIFQKVSSNYIKNYDKIGAGIKKRLTVLKVNDFEA
jgi:hypothetical protein